MALRQTLNDPSRVVRRVVVANGAAVVTDMMDSWLPADFKAPTSDPPTEDESPRDGPAHTLRYSRGWKSLARGVQLTAGARVERRGYGVYELLSAPKEIRSGTLVEGWSVPAVHIGSLYPTSAALEAQGGAVLVNSLYCAIWGGSDHREPAGEYEDYDGETAAEYADVLKPNTQLAVGSRKFRVIDATVDLTGPRVKLSLRSPRV